MANQTVAIGRTDISQPAMDLIVGGLTPVRPDQVAPCSKAEWDEAVYIPEAARKSRLLTFQLSVPTLFFLNDNGFWVAGDLHNLTFREIHQCRWCDLRALAEVHRLVRSLQRAHGLWSASDICEQRQCEQASNITFQKMVCRRRRMRRRARTKRLIQRSTVFSVPENVRPLNPFDLPLSVRLEKALRRRGVHCLGQLHATPVRHLRELGNFGARSVGELNRLIERAAAGEFSTPPADAAWAPAELVRTLDVLMAQLPDRNREILALRLGADDDQARTLQSIAKRYQLTRERVRQVVLQGVNQIRKAGSLPLRWHLEQLDDRRRAASRPLSTTMLGQWLPSAARCNFPLVFYVRLIGRVQPGIKNRAG